MNNYIDILKTVIGEQYNSIIYSTNKNNFTTWHNANVYIAIANLIDSHPNIISYLMENSRSGGFQHKIFQEYVRVWENDLPASFPQYNKHIYISDISDSHLGIFNGISYFTATVNHNQEVKNGTLEFYYGGRKCAYMKPYYIGKLLSISDKNDVSLMDKVIEYSFLKIKMRDILPGTEVKIAHLRVPPHYQMGGMVYINRIKKKIVDQAKLILKY